MKYAMKRNKSSIPQFMKRIIWFVITDIHQLTDYSMNRNKSSIHQK